MIDRNLVAAVAGAVAFCAVLFAVLWLVLQ